MLKKNPPTILIATPGRMADIANKKLLNFENLRFFVMDECDKLLAQADMRTEV